MSKLFKEGGPYGIRRVGADKYKFSVPIQTQEGWIARECRDAQCSPGYFKVRLGTGILGEQTEAFCPYCRTSGEPLDFATKEQVRYVVDIAKREAERAVDKLLDKKLGLGPSGRKTFGAGLLSMSIHKKKGTSASPVRPPVEETLRRDVRCPSCGLEQSVYGLGTWCADCGADIMLSHVEAELQIIRAMLSDIERRKEGLGARVASKDLENCLEDLVSVFETVLRTSLRRWRIERSGEAAAMADEAIRKIGNAFQSVRRANDIYGSTAGVTFAVLVSPDEYEELAAILEKRHPITHNLGQADKRYLERTKGRGKEGRDVLVLKPEIERAIDLCSKLFQALHGKLFAAERP